MNTRTESTSYRQRLRVEVILLPSHVESLVSREWIVAKFSLMHMRVGFLLILSSSSASSGFLLFYSSLFYVCRYLQTRLLFFSFFPFFFLLLLIHPRARFVRFSILSQMFYSRFYNALLSYNAPAALTRLHSWIRDYCFVFPAFYALVRKLNAQLTRSQLSC